MASSFSGALWERLFNTYLIIALIVGVLVVGWLFYNMVMFRARRDDFTRPVDAPQAGIIAVERGRALWSWITALLIAGIMFGLAFSTISAVDAIEHPPEGEPWQHYNVTGFQFGWKYGYVGEGGVPFTVIGDWTVPVDTVVVLNITSQDVWHNFAIPDFRIRVDAIPGTVSPLWFRADEVGPVQNVCVQICGSSHAIMKTTMNVVARAEYDAWVAEQSGDEYDKLSTSFYKDARRGTVQNMTVTDSAIEVGNVSVVADKPVVFNVTNNAGSEVTFTVTAAGATNSVTVPAGEDARMYFLAPKSGALQVSTSNGQSATLQVVS